MQSPDRGKSKALRIRLDYYRQPIRIDRVRKLLVSLGVLASVLYGGWLLMPGPTSGSSSSRLHLSSGPVAEVHAAFESDCEKCHSHGLAVSLGKHSFQFDPVRRLDHQESSCQNCHQVEGHWRATLRDPSQDRDCANCHHEHTGRLTKLTQVTNQACAECHRDLQSVCRAGTLSADVLSTKDFSPSTHGVMTADGQMQFRSLLFDKGRIKFDHAQHLQPGQVDSGRRGGMRLGMLPATVRQRLRTPGQADTELVTLNCASCHQLHSLKSGRQHVVGSEEGRYYAPINFEKHCQACHQMTFPGQTGQMLPLPHVTSIAEYELLLSARQEALEVQSRAGQALPDQDSSTPNIYGKRITTSNSSNASEPTKAARTGSLSVTMNSLMQRCQQCHLPEDITAKSIERALAGQMAPLIPNRWLVNGYFDHATHSRIENCQFCHEIPTAQAGTSSPPTDQEHVFIKGPESCVICHRSSQTEQPSVLKDAQKVHAMLGNIHQPTWASDNCTLCHRYHWTRSDAGDVR